MLNSIQNTLNKYFENIHIYELFKKSSVSFMIRILAVLTSYIFTFLIAKIYGADALGIFALSQTILLIFSIIARLGLDTASVKNISKYHSKKNFSKLEQTYYLILKIIFFTSIILSSVLFLVLILLQIF